MPLEHMLTSSSSNPFKKPYSEVLAKLKVILDDRRWNSSGAHRYASGPAHILLDHDLQREVSRFAALPSLAFGSSNTSNVNIWIGNSGTTAALHYDTSHNFYAVIEGTKNFQILPPSYLTKVSFHSSVHPLYRQAKVLHICAYIYIYILLHLSVERTFNSVFARLLRM